MRAHISRFISDDSGATAIEYGLIGALLSLAIIVGAGLLGNSVSNLFMKVGNGVGAVNAGI